MVTAGTNIPAASLAVTVMLPGKAKFTGVSDRVTATDVLLTTMRETLEGEALTAMMVIDKENVVEPAAFLAVIM